MRVLITGGAGFVGSNLVRWSLHNRPDVDLTVLDSFTYAANEASLSDLGAEISVVRGSVADQGLVDRLVRDTDVVLHLAAESHNDNSLLNPAQFVETNVLGTCTVLEAVRRHDRRLHHVSTDEVFGELGPDDAPFTEGSPYTPSSPYSASKAGSDLLVRAWSRSFGVAATISNSSNIYGPFQHIEKFIPRQITNIIDGRRPVLYGTGANVRDWIHVDDHSAAVWAILEGASPGESFLVSAGCSMANRQMLGLLLEILGRPADDIEYVRDRPGHDFRYASDAAKLRTRLGWEPRHTSLRTGLEATVRWYEANEPWWRPSKGATEDRYERLGHRPARS